MKLLLFIAFISFVVAQNYVWIVDSGSSGMKISFFVNNELDCPDAPNENYDLYCPDGIKGAKLVDLVSGAPGVPSIATYVNFLSNYQDRLNIPNLQFISYATAGNRIVSEETNNLAWDGLVEGFKNLNLVAKNALIEAKIREEQAASGEDVENVRKAVLEKIVDGRLIIEDKIKVRAARTLHGTEEAQWEFIVANTVRNGAWPGNNNQWRGMLSVGGASSQMAMVVADNAKLYLTASYFSKTKERLARLDRLGENNECNIENLSSHYIGLFKFDPTKDVTKELPFVQLQPNTGVTDPVKEFEERIKTECKISGKTKPCVIFVSFLSDNTGPCKGKRFALKDQYVNVERTKLATCGTHLVGGLDQTSKLMEAAHREIADINVVTEESLYAWNHFLNDDCQMQLVTNLFRQTGPYPNPFAAAKYIPVGTFSLYYAKTVAKAQNWSFKGIQPYLIEFMNSLGIPFKSLLNIKTKLDWATAIAKANDLQNCGLHIHKDWKIKKNDPTGAELRHGVAADKACDGILQLVDNVSLEELSESLGLLL